MKHWPYINIFYLIIAWVEVEDTYALSAVNTLQEAVNTILKFLGLGAAEGTDKVNEGVHTHTLLCSGECSIHHIFNPESIKILTLVIIIFG